MLNRLLTPILMCAWAASSQENPGITIEDSGDTVTSEQPAAPAATPVKKRFEPLCASQAIGALHIKVYPSDAQVFINGQLVGKGDQYLPDLDVGFYNVFVKTDKESKSEQVTVVAASTTEKNYRLGRSVYFVCESSFSQNWSEKTRSYGPSLTLGVKAGKNVFSSNFVWGFWDNGDVSSQNVDLHYPLASDPARLVLEDATTVGGAFLSWQYEVLNFRDIICILPGAFSGLFDAYGSRSTYTKVTTGTNSYSYYPTSDTSWDRIYFGGLCVQLLCGYSRVFASAKYSMLVGTGVGHQFNFGISGRL